MNCIKIDLLLKNGLIFNALISIGSFFEKEQISHATFLVATLQHSEIRIRSLQMFSDPKPHFSKIHKNKFIGVLKWHHVRAPCASCASMHKPMNKFIIIIINTMKMRNTELSQEVCQIKNKYGFVCSFMFSRCIYVITYQFIKFSLCEKQRIYTCAVHARTMENVESNEFISPTSNCHGMCSVEY